MRLTTLLDTLALLLVAIGAAAGLWSLIGPASIAVGGLVVGLGSWAADREAPQEQADPVLTLAKVRGVAAKARRRRGREAA